MVLVLGDQAFALPGAQQLVDRFAADPGHIGQLLLGQREFDARGDSYRVRMVSSTNGPVPYYSQSGSVAGLVPRDAIVLVRMTGAELEIAGHEYVSD